MSFHNDWYSRSYDSIFKMADWKTFSADIPAKFTCIFAWMPMQLLNVRHGGKQAKGDVFSYEHVQSTLAGLDSTFNRFRGQTLLGANLQDKLQRADISSCAQPLAGFLGWVGASKYLHFSHPQMFLMWDRGIIRQCNAKGVEVSATTDGYLRFLEYAQSELQNPERHSEALCCANGDYGRILRGLDILHMGER